MFIIPSIFHHLILPPAPPPPHPAAVLQQGDSVLLALVHLVLLLRPQLFERLQVASNTQSEQH